MTELIAMTQEEYELPAYSDKGKIIIEVGEKINVPYYHEWEWEIVNLTYDCDASPFWLSEGMGIDYWINSSEVRDEITSPGFWTIDGVNGEYIKGEWGYTDDDEEWYFDTVRPASDDEVQELLGVSQ